MFGPSLSVDELVVPYFIHQPAPSLAKPTSSLPIPAIEASNLVSPVSKEFMRLAVGKFLGPEVTVAASSTLKALV